LSNKRVGLYGYKKGAASRDEITVCPWVIKTHLPTFGVE